MNLPIQTKNLISPLLILSIFFTFGFYATTIHAHSDNNENNVTIHVDENGYTPNEVTIKPNTEIVFENIGNNDHWPATDNHPSHTLYDGTSLEEHCADESSKSFDSCGPVSTEESWSFTFEKVGTFNYHDHIWPHLGGKIIVKDEVSEKINNKNIIFYFLNSFRQVFAKIASFFISHEKNFNLNSGSTENEFYENLQFRYKNIVLEKDPREAIHSLQKESSTNSEVLALCHDTLHSIGHTAYQKYGSFQEAAKFQSDFCNSGYIHGIFESYFENTDNPLSGLKEQCNEYASISGRDFDLWQCHHGVGHGFMYLTGGDLDKSLLLCEEELGKDGAPSCQNGVFMEVFNLEVLAKENSFIDPNNPFLTCSDRNTAKEDCYFYIPTYLSQTTNMGFSDIFNECNNAEPGYKLSCIQGVGSEAIKRNMDDPKSVFAMCNQAGSFINREACAIGITGMYMNQIGSHTSGKELCEQAPQEFQSTCNITVNKKESFF